MATQATRELVFLAAQRKHAVTEAVEAAQGLAQAEADLADLTAVTKQRQIRWETCKEAERRTAAGVKRLARHINRLTESQARAGASAAESQAVHRHVRDELLPAQQGAPVSWVWL